MQCEKYLEDVAEILNNSRPFQEDLVVAVKQEILRREAEIKTGFNPLTRHFTDELIRKHSDLNVLRLYVERLEDEIQKEDPSHGS
jgi:hypothetical protein